jgi:predicted dehydrogenase
MVWQPFATTLERANTREGAGVNCACSRILEAGRAAGRKNQVFQVDFQTRADTAHLEGVQKVHDGMFGKVGLIQSFYYDGGQWRTPVHRLRPASPGGNSSGPG